jgi:hypothetical protein
MREGPKGLICDVAMIGENNREGDGVRADMVHKLHAVKEHREVRQWRVASYSWEVG